MALEVASNMLINLKGFAKSFILGTTNSAAEDEGAISIFLGGLLGSLFGARGGMIENKQLRKAAGEEAGRYSNLFDKLGPQAFAHLIENKKSILKKGDSTEVEIEGKKVTVPTFERKTDENGKEFFAVDEDSVLNKTVNELANSNYWDASSVAAYTNDQLMSEYNDEMALAHFAYQLATDPKRYSKEEIKQFLSTLSNIANEEAKVLSIDTLVDQNYDKVLKYVDKIEQLDSAHNPAKHLDNPDEYYFQDFIKKLKFFSHTKTEALNRLTPLAKKVDTITALGNLMLDQQEITRQLEEEEAEIRKEYDKRITSVRKLNDEAFQLREKKNKTPEEQSRLKELAYILAENKAINGTYNVATDNSTAGYGVISSPLRQVQITPGTKDFKAYRSGKQVLGLSDLAEEVKDPEISADKLSRKFRSSVITKTPQADTIQDAILNRIEEEMKGQEEHMAYEDDFLDFVKGIIAIEDENSLDDIYDEDNLNTELLISELKKRGVKVPKVFNAEVVEKLLPVLQDIASTLSDKLKERSNNVRLLEIEKAKLQQVYDSDETTRQDRYESSPDKNDFLVEEHFDDTIWKDYQSLETIFDVKQRLDEPFEDARHMNYVLANLKLAQEAFKNRKDITADKQKEILAKIQTGLDKINKEIYPAILEYAKRMGVIQRQSNRVAVDGIVLVLDLTNPKSEVYKIAKEIIGEKLDDIVDEIIAEDGISSYDGLILLVDKIFKSASETQLKIIKDHLLKNKNTLVEQLFANLPPIKFNKVNIDSYADNPLGAVQLLVVKVIDSSKVNNQDSSVFAYLQDLDLDELARRMVNDPLLSDEDRRVLSLLRTTTLRLNYINNLLVADNSTLDVKSYIEHKKELISNVKPSLQQSIVLSNILQFLFNKGNKYGNYANWLLFRGIGGAGKTLVVSKLMVQLYQRLSGKDPRTSILAASHTPETSANINKAIFGDNKTPTTTLDSIMLMTDDQLSKIDFIVLDEIFAFTNSAVANLKTKLIAHAEATNHTIKVIATGDPSQLINEDSPIMLSTLSKSMAQTIPLTVSFRTNVGPISSFINSYRMSPVKVSGIPAQANTTIEQQIEDVTNSVGVQSVTEDEIDSLVTSPSKRSRVLIVPTLDAAAKLQSKFGKAIAIRTVAQVQGFQWDEVYVLGSPEEFGVDNININRALYTAFSRAKQFLAVDSRFEANQVEANESAGHVTDESTEEVQQTIEFYDAQMMATNNVVNMLSGIKMSGTTKVEAVPVDEEAPVVDSDIARADIGAYAVYDESELDSNPISIPSNTSAKLEETSFGSGKFTFKSDKLEVTVGTPIGSDGFVVGVSTKSNTKTGYKYNTALSSKFDTLEEAKQYAEDLIAAKHPELVDTFSEHFIAHPINYGLTGTVPNVALNSVANIIRVLDNGKEFYYIIAPHATIPNRYIPVAVLGDHDFKSENGEYFNNAIGQKQDIYLDKVRVESGRDGFELKGPIDSLSLGKVKIKSFSPLRTRYDMSNFVESDTLLDDMIIKFYDTFFGLTDSGRRIFTQEYSINPQKD